MKLKITTPEKLILEKGVDSVTLPGAAGQLTPLSGHDLMITPLANGRLFLQYLDEDLKEKRRDYEISGGLVEITGDAVNVFAESAKQID